EIGDKTQVATVLLAAKYASVPLVVAGTTLGMLAANVPVVLAADFAADRLPMRLIRAGTALLFVVLGVLALFARGLTA
ncbi:MAG TPA: TMEM165/GDT1 family protein, partial [Gammaproteobacteria bacterium]|nr:TMEM165/GDT1 family protein [Gammaproteobacteria bacterium]